MSTPFDPFAYIPGQVMQTHLTGGTPFVQPPGCGPGRVESTVRIQKGGKFYNFVFRDKIMPEDWYITAMKAAAFSIKRTEQYRGVPPPRTVRDFLVKSNLIV
jgi:hypothetical protein